MSKILITGGQGRLGQGLVQYIESVGQHSVVSFGHDELDVTKPGQVHSVMALERPEFVINCAGLLSFQSEMRHKDAWDVNVLGANHVVFACEKFGARIVQISTDYVYSGLEGNYAEYNPPDPINYYGFTKAVAEAVVAAASGHALILRAPFRYDGPWPYDSVFIDQYISGRWMSQVVPDIVLAALAHDLEGILHIGGPRRNLLSMAREASPNVEFKIWPRENFKPVRVPRDTSLDSSRWLQWKKARCL